MRHCSLAASSQQNNHQSYEPPSNVVSTTWGPSNSNSNSHERTYQQQHQREQPSILIDLTVDGDQDDGNIDAEQVRDVENSQDDVPSYNNSCTIVLSSDSEDEIEIVSEDPLSSLEFIGESRNKFTASEMEEWRKRLWIVIEECYKRLSSAEGDHCKYTSEEIQKDDNAINVMKRASSALGAGHNIILHNDNTKFKIQMELKIGELVQISKDALRRLTDRAIDEEFLGKQNELKDCVVVSSDDEAENQINQFQKIGGRRNRSRNRKFVRCNDNTEKKNRKSNKRKRYYDTNSNNSNGSTIGSSKHNLPIRKGRIGKDRNVSGSTRTNPRLRCRKYLPAGVTEGAARAAARVNEIAIKRSIGSSNDGEKISNSNESEDDDGDETDICLGNNSNNSNKNKKISSAKQSRLSYGIGAAMLQKMGWQKGEGLGVNKDGRTETVKARVRNRRVGVGR